MLIVAALIVVPLYTTGTIRLGEYEDIPLVAPPPPPALMAAGGPVVSHVTHPKARLTYDLHKLRAPNAIPKKISHEDAGGAPPDLGGVFGGVPGGVAGGQIGGLMGGVLDGTGTVAPPFTRTRQPRLGATLGPGWQLRYAWRTCNQKRQLRPLNSSMSPIVSNKLKCSLA